MPALSTASEALHETHRLHRRYVPSRRSGCARSGVPERREENPAENLECQESRFERGSEVAQILQHPRLRHLHRHEPPAARIADPQQEGHSGSPPRLPRSRRGRTLETQRSSPRRFQRKAAVRFLHHQHVSGPLPVDLECQARFLHPQRSRVADARPRHPLRRRPCRDRRFARPAAARIQASRQKYLDHHECDFGANEREERLAGCPLR